MNRRNLSFQDETIELGRRNLARYSLRHEQKTKSLPSKLDLPFDVPHMKTAPIFLNLAVLSIDRDEVECY